MSETVSASAPKTGLISRRGIRALGVAGATAAALAVWAIAHPLAGVDLGVRMNGSVEEVTPTPIVIVSVLAGLAGWALLAVLERSARRAKTVWTAIAAVALLLSLAGPLTSAVTTAATVALLCMHLVVGAILIGTLTRK
jgi:hypothetical protein